MARCVRKVTTTCENMRTRNGSKFVWSRHSPSGRWRAVDSMPALILHPAPRALHREVGRGAPPVRRRGQPWGPPPAQVRGQPRTPHRALPPEPNRAPARAARRTEAYKAKLDRRTKPASTPRRTRSWTHWATGRQLLLADGWTTRVSSIAVRVPRGASAARAARGASSIADGVSTNRRETPRRLARGRTVRGLAPRSSPSWARHLASRSSPRLQTAAAMQSKLADRRKLPIRAERRDN
jgi:hypothetical protein